MTSWRNETVLGLALVLLGLAILVANLNIFHVGGAVLGLLVFGGAGLVFLTVYRRDAENWWAVIPAASLFGLAAVTVLESFRGMPSGVSGAAFLWSSAISFVVLFRREPRFFWAAVPGGLLGTLGLLALFSGTQVGGALFALVLYWAVGVAFAAIFLRRPDRWWAVIPAGAFFSMGLTTLIGRAGWAGASVQGFVFNLGLAATFGFLFLIRNEENELRWTKVPAIILLGISILFLFSALSWDGLVKLVSALLVAAGLYLLYSALRTKRGGRA